jgi:hypothetical protein
MAEIPWHQFACLEATVDHAAANLANTDASEPGSHMARAVLIRSDRMWDNEIVRANAGLFVFHSLT